MAIDISYVLANLIVFIIEIVIFYLSLQIYRKTKGASLAYNMWAKATFLMLFGTFIRLINAIFFEGTTEISTNKNEIVEIVGNTIMALGFFYIPVGMMYLSRDLGTGNVNNIFIERTRILFYTFIGSMAIFYLLLFPIYKIVSTVLIMSLILFIVIFTFTLIIYNNLYKQFLKTTNSCWLYLYIGIFFMIVSEFFEILSFFIPLASYPQLMLQSISAVGFIGGFYKLAKMVEAI